MYVDRKRMSLLAGTSAFTVPIGDAKEKSTCRYISGLGPVRRGNTAALGDDMFHHSSSARKGGDDKFQQESLEKMANFIRDTLRQGGQRKARTL